MGISGDRDRHFHGSRLSDNIPCSLRLDHYKSAVLSVGGICSEVLEHRKAVCLTAEKPVLARTETDEAVPGCSTGVGAATDVAAGLPVQDQGG